MVRAFLRLVILLVLLAAVGAFLLGWWGSNRADNPPSGAVGTSGVNTERARQVGAEIGERTAAAAKEARDVGAKVGERTAAAASEARQALANSQITAKIKAKMALDDSVKALAVNVDTNGTIVSVSGTVATAAQRERVLQLARETQGVTQVVDNLRVR